MRRTNDHCIIDEMSLCLLIVAEKSGRWADKIYVFAHSQDCPQGMMNKIQEQL
ncbi:MAG: hypothetical protein KDF59_05685 [Nitrosomonas sp.]|nr:hypothetical protein [Nitrosomonas sp.]